MGDGLKQAAEHLDAHAMSVAGNLRASPSRTSPPPLPCLVSQLRVEVQPGYQKHSRINLWSKSAPVNSPWICSASVLLT